MIELKLIPCDSFKAVITQNTCERNRHIALDAYNQIKSGKAIGDLSEHTIDRLIACGNCLTGLIDKAYLMDKARTEVKMYIDIVETCMTKNVDILPPGEAAKQASQRHYRKLSKAEEREAEILKVLQEHPDEWIAPGEYELPPATFEVVAKLYKQNVIKTTQVTQNQCIRAVYMWVGEIENESEVMEEEETAGIEDDLY